MTTLKQKRQAAQQAATPQLNLSASVFALLIVGAVLGGLVLLNIEIWTAIF